MRESGYYPAGAEFDSLAPWNQVEPNEIELEVEIELKVTKNIKVVVKEGYTDDDICDAIDNVIKQTVLIDDENKEWHIDGFEVLDYYEL